MIRSLIRRYRHGLAVDRYRERVRDGARWYDQQMDKVERLPEPQRTAERHKLDVWFANFLDGEDEAVARG